MIFFLVSSAQHVCQSNEKGRRESGAYDNWRRNEACADRQSGGKGQRDNARWHDDQLQKAAHSLDNARLGHYLAVVGSQARLNVANELASEVVALHEAQVDLGRLDALQVGGELVDGPPARLFVALEADVDVLSLQVLGHLEVEVEVGASIHAIVYGLVQVAILLAILLEPAGGALVAHEHRVVGQLAAESAVLQELEEGHRLHVEAALAHRERNQVDLVVDERKRLTKHVEHVDGRVHGIAEADRVDDDQIVVERHDRVARASARVVARHERKALRQVERRLPVDQAVAKRRLPRAGVADEDDFIALSSRLLACDQALREGDQFGSGSLASHFAQAVVQVGHLAVDALELVDVELELERVLAAAAHADQLVEQSALRPAPLQPALRALGTHESARFGAW